MVQAKKISKTIHKKKVEFQRAKKRIAKDAKNMVKLAQYAKIEEWRMNRRY
jgi:hypothetical protein